MSEKHTFSAVSAQFTLACNLSTLYMMLAMVEGFSTRVFPGALLGFAPLIYLLNRLFLRNSRPLQSLWILNATATVLFLALCCWADDFSGLLQRLPMMLICTIWVLFKGVYAALDGPSLSNMLLLLDSNVLILILFSFYASVTGLPLFWSLPVICGFVFAILGITARRSNRAFGLKEWLFMAVAFSFIFTAMWLLVGFVAAPAGSGLMTLWTALLQLVAFAGNLIFRFLLFIASLLPTLQMDAELPPPDEVCLTPDATASEIDPRFGLILLALFVILVLFAALRLMQTLRKQRVGGKTAGSVSVQHRKRLSLRNALKKLLAEWDARLLQAKFLWSYRNTAAGLYFILVRRLRTTPWHTLPGETPREFLTRLLNGVQHHPSLAESLSHLIPAVDDALYGGSPVSQPFPQASKIRREIRHALQQRSQATPSTQS